VRRETLSLDAPIVEEPSATLLDVTVDRSAPEPHGGAELAELLEAAGELPSREREMLGLSFAGHSVAEIARAYGCSESLVSQLLSDARFRLGERTAA
jgi:RNA polymerase sigma factor (sigma-70 family)